MLNLELMDKSNSQITATAFGDASVKFNQLFQVGKVYVISNTKCKIVNKKYTSINHDYSIDLTTDSIVQEVAANANDYSGMGYNFKTLKQIKENVQLY